MSSSDSSTPNPPQKVKLGTLVLIGVIILIVLGGCISTLTDSVSTKSANTVPSTSSSKEWEPSTKVDWDKYASSVKVRIDTNGKEKNCIELQEDFDVAERMNSAQFNRVGNGNGDLMGYINDWMQHADCY